MLYRPEFFSPSPESFQLYDHDFTLHSKVKVMMEYLFVVEKIQTISFSEFVGHLLGLEKKYRGAILSSNDFVSLYEVSYGGLYSESEADYLEELPPKLGFPFNPYNLNTRIWQEVSTLNEEGFVKLVWQDRPNDPDGAIEIYLHLQDHNLPPEEDLWHLPEIENSDDPEHTHQALTTDQTQSESFWR